MSEPSVLETTEAYSEATAAKREHTESSVNDPTMNETPNNESTIQDDDRDVDGVSFPDAPSDIENPVDNTADKRDVMAKAPEDVEPEHKDSQQLATKVPPAPDAIGGPEQHTEETLQPKKTKKTRGEANPDFEDLQQTGGWGKLSKWDCIVGGVVALLAIIAAIVAAVVVHNNKKNTRSTPKTPAPISLPATPAPSLAPQVSPAVLISEVLRIVGNNTYTNASLQSLPNNVSFYKGKANDTTQAHEVRAMSWLLYDDPRKQLDGVEFRYSLAALYYAWVGSNWTNGTNWLTGLVACDWFGVECDIATGDITELYLAYNHLVGTIPDELSLLTNLVSLDLANNQLSGTLPGDVVGSLPVLSILNIANNSFTGTFPSNLGRNGVLRE
jgi:hypothetical protein